jgi:hypothetical protein
MVSWSVTTRRHLDFVWISGIAFVFPGFLGFSLDFRDFKDFLWISEGLPVSKIRRFPLD